ncbi:MAG: phosphomannomutase/phosphoglucomutase [Anaerolineales bacterium]|nr:phosphomannomutase/phosphoglucomutase [Anaerolineales bacterium]
MGSDLDAERMVAIGQGVGKWFVQRGGRSLVAGCDVRESSPQLHQALIEGILAAGLDVIDVNRVPTPLLNFATDYYQASGGVMVTASHNPREYNGLKIRAGRTVYGEALEEIYKLSLESQPAAVKGRCQKIDPLPVYTAEISRRTQLRRPLHVVVDGGNGMNGLVVPGLLRGLGCRVTELYCQPDGSFSNRDPDPTAPGATDALAAAVLEQQAQMGLAFDGDGDRVILVDEMGRPVLGDVTLMLLARSALKKQPGAKVVYEVLCSQAVADDIAAHGGQAVAAPSGYAYVHNQMLESGATLGGEMSGHFFLLDDMFKFDDAILAAVQCVALVANQDRPLSALVDDLPRYFSSRELRLACPDVSKSEIVQAVDAHYAVRYPVERLDGARIIFPDGWAMVRQSNTQPVISLRFETKASSEHLWEIASQVLHTLANEYTSRGIHFPLDLTKPGVEIL